MSTLLAATPDQLAAVHLLQPALAASGPSSEPLGSVSGLGGPATLAQLQDGSAALSEEQLLSALCDLTAGEPSLAYLMPLDVMRAVLG